MVFHVASSYVVLDLNNSCSESAEDETSSDGVLSADSADEYICSESDLENDTVSELSDDDTSENVLVPDPNDLRADNTILDDDTGNQKYLYVVTSNSYDVREWY